MQVAVDAALSSLSEGMDVVVEGVDTTPVEVEVTLPAPHPPCQKLGCPAWPLILHVHLNC